jgi:hypothetical protein
MSKIKEALLNNIPFDQYIDSYFTNHNPRRKIVKKKHSTNLTIAKNTV